MFGIGSQRAVYAADPTRSRGRLVAETPPAPGRSQFQRDRDRIVHSTAFRRLKHKTQVFVYHEGDHYRTRLTHTLEVAQIARSIARALGLDEDLAEALALAHDLGHPPFGHAGERALDRAMHDHGGFDHNAQSLRAVTQIERRYAEFDGLNLTWETLEGLVKHNGPLTDRAGRPIGRYAEEGLPHAIKAYSALQDLMLWSWPSAEAQVAAISDDIAYDSHDIDDGIRAGLFTLDDLVGIGRVGKAIAEVRGRYPGLERSRETGEVLRRLITAMIEDVVAETERRVAGARPRSVDDVRLAAGPLVAFSPEMAPHDRQVKEFLFKRMYRNDAVMRVMADAEKIVEELFAVYMADIDELPRDWRTGLGADRSRRARRVADFIAGMTDRYAIDEHRRLFDATPELR
ncbi:MAG TPA: deoxyguanosinetriphosphate triphosphohydrolase [Kaistiaceae bacterium]|nr:deoxyguanosinetriphosphate triphosphohydrolase [Kaistiaceae bacterium]